jgi:hypothetical protein
MNSNARSRAYSGHPPPVASLNSRARARGGSALKAFFRLEFEPCCHLCRRGLDCDPENSLGPDRDGDWCCRDTERCNRRARARLAGFGLRLEERG